LQKIKKSQL